MPTTRPTPSENTTVVMCSMFFDGRNMSMKGLLGPFGSIAVSIEALSAPCILRNLLILFVSFGLLSGSKMIFG
jgi:hypothetical protein